MAIVKHIVEAHGSKVIVNSIVDEGSEFSFQLKKIEEEDPTTFIVMKQPLPLSAMWTSGALMELR